jgi:hypothetical protein
MTLSSTKRAPPAFTDGADRRAWAGGQDQRAWVSNVLGDGSFHPPLRRWDPPVLVIERTRGS